MFDRHWTGFRVDRRRFARWTLSAFVVLASVGAVLAAIASGGTMADSSFQSAPPTPLVRHSASIRKPHGAPTIGADRLDDRGMPIVIACATCHATKPTNSDAKLGQPLNAFHQNMAGQHANLTCVSCHNPTDGYDSLRLADGRSVPFPEVMTLCAQCHGPQFRDYQHGAHGGMTGFWDLTRGGRERNNCIDCHGPHAPKFPIMIPAKGPNDRFLRGDRNE